MDSVSTMASPALAVPVFTRSEKVFTLAGALLGLLLAALDQTIVATAGPALQADLGIPASLYPWITTSYLVASTVMVPLWGKLSDLFGRRSVLVAGILIFLTGSFLCGVAWNTVSLVLFRAVQGLGSAALFTSALAVVADLFPPAERGKYQGLFGGVFGLSSVAGPLAGGFITDTFGWHWVFFINLPVGALALAIIFLRMPRLRPRGLARPKLDLVGAACLVLVVVPLLLALSLGRGHAVPGELGFAWGSWQVLSLFAVAAVGVVLFLAVEARAGEPLLDLRLFQDKTFALGNLAVFIVGAGFLSAFTFLPLYMVNVLELSATRSGMTITPLTLGVVAGNILSGQLVARVGRYRGLMLVSLVVLSVAFAVMGFTLSPDSSHGTVTAKMVLMGLGMGPSIPLYTLAIQNAVPPRQIGVATSSATFFRQLGMTMGVALMGTVFAGTLASELRTRTAQSLEEVVHAPGTVGEGAAQGQALATVDRGHATKEAFTRATSAVYRVCIAVALLALLVTVFLPERPLRRGHSPAPPVE
jgi:EmrB/QacA subfamily drug resistance transporter